MSAFGDGVYDSVPSVCYVSAAERGTLAIFNIGARALVNRRDMLRATLAGALGTGGELWAPKALLADDGVKPAADPAADPAANPTVDPMTAPLAGGLYYTRDRPGRWRARRRATCR